MNKAHIRGLSVTFYITRKKSANLLSPSLNF